MKVSFAFAASTLVALSNVGQSHAQTPTGFSPALNTTLSVTFGSGSLTAGASVALEQTQISPALSLPKPSDNTSSYVLLMVDLDAPGGINNNSYAPFLHWLTPLSAVPSDVPSNQSSASAVAPFVGPAPPVGTGKHRYVILLLSVPSTVFQWPSTFPAFDATSLESRIQFDYNKFAEAGGFQPVAANWFTTENKTTTPPTYTAGASSSHNTVFASAMAGVGAFVALALASV